MTDRLTGVFAEVLEVDESILSDDSSPDNLDSWDSLASMHLVAAIEKTFSVRLTTKEIMKMMTIGLARQTLLAKGVDIQQ